MLDWLKRFGRWLRSWFRKPAPAAIGECSSVPIVAPIAASDEPIREWHQPPAPEPVEPVKSAEPAEPLRPEPPASSVLNILDTVIPPAATPAAPAKARSRAGKPIGRLKADILDQLERYQVYIKRLKKCDREAYGQYRRLGAYLCNNDMEAYIHALEPELVQRLPSFGAVAIGLAADCEVANPTPDDNVPCRFAYFSRLERPGHDVERVNRGVTYRCRMYFDDARDKKIREHGRGVGSEFLVNVLPDGEVRALRMLKSECQVIRHRKGGGSSMVHHQRWGIPQLGDPVKKGSFADLTPAESVCRMFTLCMNFWQSAARHSMIRITATKDQIVMPFVVDATQTPTFFADREPVISPDGVKKRIFHIVRPHVRQAKGKTVGVRLHFVGLRKFAWHGYDIAISVPGRDHLDINDINALNALEDLPEAERDDKATIEEMADLIADTIGAPGKREVAHEAA